MQAERFEAAAFRLDGNERDESRGESGRPVEQLAWVSEHRI